MSWSAPVIKKLIALALLAVFGVAFMTLLLGYTPDAELNQTARYYAERTAADLGAANIVTAKSPCCFSPLPSLAWCWRRGRRPQRLPRAPGRRSANCSLPAHVSSCR
jgi:hypothetical protein